MFFFFFYHTKITYCMIIPNFCMNHTEIFLYDIDPFQHVWITGIMPLIVTAVEPSSLEAAVSATLTTCSSIRTTITR